MVRVSIIIPAYNPGRFIREAVQSVYAQSYKDWELLVVDDSSSEDLSWLIQEFPGVNLIRQQHGGASVARNNGILHSTGEYIAFMDQDDVWRPRKMERQVTVMDSAADIAVCYCDLTLIDAEGSPMVTHNAGVDDLGGAEQESEVVSRLALDGSKESANERLSKLHRSVLHFSSRFVVPSTVMLRRACLATSGLLDPFIPFSGDYDLLIKLGGRHKIIEIPVADVLYRKHSNNFSNQYNVGRREVKALVARYRAYADAQGDKRLAKDAKRLFGRPSRMYAAQAFDNARGSLKERQFRPFARHLWRAFLFSPIFVLGSLSRWAVGQFTSKAKPKGSLNDPSNPMSV